MLGGIEWEISAVHSVTDGDTLRLFRTRTENLDDYVAHTIFDRPDVFPRGISVRLINLDTPERGDALYLTAKYDVVNWMMEHALDDLKVMTWSDGGFSRFLGDVYYIDSSGVYHSLTEWMLTKGNNGQGWEPFVWGK